LATHENGMPAESVGLKPGVDDGWKVGQVRELVVEPQRDRGVTDRHDNEGSFA
jgi:hypothetical protein